MVLGGCSQPVEQNAPRGAQPIIVVRLILCMRENNKGALARTPEEKRVWFAQAKSDADLLNPEEFDAYLPGSAPQIKLLQRSLAQMVTAVSHNDPAGFEVAKSNLDRFGAWYEAHRRELFLLTDERAA